MPQSDFRGQIWQIIANNKRNSGCQKPNFPSKDAYKIQRTKAKKRNKCRMHQEHDSHYLYYNLVIKVFIKVRQ